MLSQITVQFKFMKTTADLILIRGIYNQLAPKPDASKLKTRIINSEVLATNSIVTHRLYISQMEVVMYVKMNMIQ